MRPIAYRSVVFDATSNATGIMVSTGAQTRMVASSHGPEKLLDALLYVPDYSQLLLRVAWDLDDFCAPLLRLLGTEICKRLAEPSHTAYYGPYKIYYIPGKMFSVRRGSGNEGTVYNLGQFFVDIQEYASEPERITDVVRRAEILLDALKELGITPSKLVSPIAVYEAIWKNKLDIPTAADVPQDAVDCLTYALNCDRSWVSNYQVGHWGEGESHDYDISGAYPFVAALLPDLRDLEFVYSKKMIWDADFGFLCGRVKVNKECMISPITAIRKGGGHLQPSGEWPDYITLPKARMLKARGLGDVRIKDGWFLTIKKDSRQRRFPFLDLMRDLYEQRGRSSIAYRFAKRGANGLIGKMIETRKADDGDAGSVRLGDYYNPIYHCIITDLTSLRVASLLYDNGIGPVDGYEKLICVTIDGCRTTVPLKLPEIPPVMGSWRYSGSAPCFVLSPGMVFTGSKRPAGKGIDYALLADLIREHPRKSTYRTTVTSPVAFYEALDKDDWSEIGLEKQRETGIDFNLLKLNQDREYDKFPRTGEQLLNNKYLSRPIVISGR